MVAEAMSKRARTRSARGKKAKGLKVKNSNQAPAIVPQAQRSAVHRLIGTFGFYLACLYDTAIDLLFVAIFVRLHLTYEQHVVESLPIGSIRVVSLVLVTVLGVFRVMQVVQFNLKGYK